MNDALFLIRRGRARMSAFSQETEASNAGYDPSRFVLLDITETDELLGWGGGKPLLRKGNRIGVCHFEFLAPFASKSPTRDLNRITNDLIKIGVSVHELDSGRVYEGDELYKLSHKATGRLNGETRYDRVGRPKIHNYTDADCQLIQAAWNGSPVKTTAGRAEAVRALLGEDGKPRFPRFNPSTWYNLRSQSRVK